MPARIALFGFYRCGAEQPREMWQPVANVATRLIISYQKFAYTYCRSVVFPFNPKVNLEALA